MSLQHERPPSHLFAVRLWREDRSDGQAEWRGQAIYVPSGETLFFRDMAELADFMRRFTTPAAPVNTIRRCWANDAGHRPVGSVEEEMGYTDQHG